MAKSEEKKEVQVPPVEDNRTVHARICDAMKAVESISKDKRNAGQGYNFRGIDDVYNELHPILAAHGLFTTSEVLEDKHEERASQKGGLLIYRVFKLKYTVWGRNGDCVSSTIIGEGMDSGDKASNKALAVGHKYALMQLFSIPTEDAKDPENDDPAPLPRQTAGNAPRPAPAPRAPAPAPRPAAQSPRAPAAAPAPAPRAPAPRAAGRSAAPRPGSQVPAPAPRPAPDVTEARVVGGILNDKYQLDHGLLNSTLVQDLSQRLSTAGIQPAVWSHWLDANYSVKKAIDINSSWYDEIIQRIADGEIKEPNAN